jgi:hypothetical protein
VRLSSKELHMMIRDTAASTANTDGGGGRSGGGGDEDERVGIDQATFLAIMGSSSWY